MSGLGARIALVVGSLAAGGAGWFAMRQLDAEEAAGTVRAAADLFECPTAEQVASVGQVHAGDKVWLIGVTDDRWAVIRDPQRLDRPLWMPLAMVATDASAGDLPQLTCGEAIDTASTEPTPETGVTTSVSSTTPSSVVLATTSTSAATTTSTSTTLVTDTTPPIVTVTTDRAFLYVVSGVAPCVAEESLEVTIVVADPTVPITIRSIVATWTAAGGVQTANLVPVAGNRFSLQVLANGPNGGETPLTLTATGADGAGNVGTGQVVVSLRDPRSFGCAG